MEVKPSAFWSQSSLFHDSLLVAHDSWNWRNIDVTLTKHHIAVEVAHRGWSKRVATPTLNRWLKDTLVTAPVSEMVLM
jgi:hypothetical protein